MNSDSQSVDYREQWKVLIIKVQITNELVFKASICNQLQLFCDTLEYIVFFLEREIFENYWKCFKKIYIFGWKYVANTLN